MTAMSPQFGLYHERELALSEDGNVLAGLDRFLRAGGAAARNNGRDFVAVRFHMHPDVDLYHDEEDRLVLTAAAVPTAGSCPVTKSRRRSRIRSSSPASADRAAAARSCCPSRPPKCRKCTGSSRAR